VYLYLIAAENGLFKIGKSTNPRNRIAQIRTSSPCRVEPVLWIYYDEGERDLEKDLHTAFESARSHGEWFALIHEDWMTILRHLDAVGIYPKQSTRTIKSLHSVLWNAHKWGFFDMKNSPDRNVAQAVLNRLSAIILELEE